MTNRDLALGHLRQAEVRLQTARFAREAVTAADETFAAVKQLVEAEAG